eukprot:CAMPEP_0206001398 /NCGR_PEP_ID=MMETSP1464-20131121/2086_1 /ASSEMBLY_ACC=CAM_ASM_001124 /TAXON_ID=119497 /ORGANISM="Exanthemachrysis gayraliae, Strain RCC1523" /LENGTH=45 /DNA_ID= /DNA_START= /DNA_END= /DNA_ORIENTATION=
MPQPGTATMMDWSSLMWLCRADRGPLRPSSLHMHIEPPELMHLWS